LVDALILIAMSAPIAVGGAALILGIERFAAAWPQPGDAEVTAVQAVPDDRDGSIGAVTVIIANHDRAPVLVGLTPRRPGWPGRRSRTTTPSRTTRRRYRADRQATVSVVPANTTAGIPVPIPAGFRRGRLVVVVGQSGGRLRVTSVPVRITAPAAAGKLRAPVVQPPFVRPWQR
jgi:hypothetical protein